MIEEEIRKIVTQEILNSFAFLSVDRTLFLRYTDYLKQRGLL